jgi:hypothetical protein
MDRTSIVLAPSVQLLLFYSRRTRMPSCSSEMNTMQDLVATNGSNMVSLEPDFSVAL